MNIQDTLSNTEQKLDNSEKIKIYLCGVTVYDESHIGPVSYTHLTLPTNREV